jgi:PAS domain S-box-containing protein
MTSVPNINSGPLERAESAGSRPLRDGSRSGLADRSTMALAALVADGGGPLEEAGGDKTHFSLEGIVFDEAEAFGHCGRYQIDREHKRGAMGVIYKGFDTHLGREVALKFLLDEHRGHAELRDRFLQEARITARLQHAGVVPVYDLHRMAENGLFFTMMFVHGASLKDLLKKRATPSSDLPRFLTVFEKICQTMAYAHAQEVIHRDLKPSNFIVGDFGVVRVMDWGLAKLLVERRVAGGAAETSGDGEPATAALAPVPRPGGASPSRGTLGGAMGTLAYMAPEQARGESALVDKRADVFGLGAVLCEILTGHPPYDGHTFDELYRMAMRVELGPALARLDRCLADPSLVLLAKHCLSENPEDRPHDAGEVAGIMTAQLESELQRTALDMVRFFELSHDLFCLASLDGFFKRVNDNFPRVLGFTKNELQARPFLDFVHPDDLKETLDQMKKLSLGLPVVRFKNRYRDVSGRYHCFEWTAKSLPEEQVIFAVARADQPGLTPPPSPPG